MTKRTKFVITACLLSLGFVAINAFDNQYRFLSIGTLGLITVILFFWSLREGLRLDATLLTLVLPFAYTIGVGLFWFLLPTTIVARIPFVIFYGVGIYALALTANIFTVSTIRTIALVRAARGVGFVLTLFTGFLLYDAVLSLKSSLLVSTLLILLLTFPLFFQGLWVSLLDRKVSRDVLVHSLLLSTGVVQVYILLFFWPVSVVVGSLFLTVTMYVLLGLGQARLEGRLFKKTVREYLTVGVVVFVAMFFATHWG